MMGLGMMVAVLTTDDSAAWSPLEERIVGR
jgi:hypothetical protein